MHCLDEHKSFEPRRCLSRVRTPHRSGYLTTHGCISCRRKGLFIIDLDNPYEAPRFLPQGGTWEVADVQWNPHPARAEYIVSTSSQKLLIWNLYKTGQTSIEHILNKHYRAITDINWSTFNPDVRLSLGNS